MPRYFSISVSAKMIDSNVSGNERERSLGSGKCPSNVFYGLRKMNGEVREKRSSAFYASTSGGELGSD